MRKTIILLVAVLFLGTSCDQSHLQQAQVPVSPGVTQSDRVLLDGLTGKEKGRGEIPSPFPAGQTETQRMAILEGRRKQIPAIYAAFARRTTPTRARWLAEICYEKTEGTQFSPMDLAEIALAETGGHRLSSRAVSSKGALGVWQLMPERAMSHGFTPAEMRDDEKCAEAAVKELAEKLAMAKGNLPRAKRLYCGAGPAAAAYDKVRRRFRAEILREMESFSLRLVSNG